ncbi:hypothetical protein ACH4PR_55520 [Streptomyces mirabilis]|uniref:hypothetical protein n=1 Tax=Streptomyces mirabilis TaxID=68239 RepID=UPI0037933DA9
MKSTADCGVASCSAEIFDLGAEGGVSVDEVGGYARRPGDGGDAHGLLRRAGVAQCFLDGGLGSLVSLFAGLCKGLDAAVHGASRDPGLISMPGLGYRLAP